MPVHCTGTSDLANTSISSNREDTENVVECNTVDIGKYLIGCQ